MIYFRLINHNISFERDVEPGCMICWRVLLKYQNQAKQFSTCTSKFKQYKQFQSIYNHFQSISIFNLGLFWAK